MYLLGTITLIFIGVGIISALLGVIISNYEDRLSQNHTIFQDKKEISYIYLEKIKVLTDKIKRDSKNNFQVGNYKRWQNYWLDKANINKVFLRDQVLRALQQDEYDNYVVKLKKLGWAILDEPSSKDIEEGR